MPARRHALLTLAGAARALAAGALLVAMNPVAADASGPGLASYYQRHMALVGDAAWGWIGSADPQRLQRGVRQVGVGQDHWYALLQDGTLLRWARAGETPVTLMRGLVRFAAGQSGWFGIDGAGVLWHGGGAAAPPRRVAEGVLQACIGDGADYYITADGALWVQGLAHRGQYGDGKLSATANFVATAQQAQAVRAHTGHALYLGRDGTVYGTGGNRFGPLSSHGLGDKADRWGPLFEGASAIATGSRHSLALRADGSLWAWGEGFGIAPTRLMADVTEVAAGETATLARQSDGSLWQWEGGRGPRRLKLQ